LSGLDGVCVRITRSPVSGNGREIDDREIHITIRRLQGLTVWLAQRYFRHIHTDNYRIHLVTYTPAGATTNSRVSFTPDLCFWCLIAGTVARESHLRASGHVDLMGVSIGDTVV
jgi:hypothetical protein